MPAHGAVTRSYMYISVSVRAAVDAYKHTCVHTHTLEERVMLLSVPTLCAFVCACVCYDCEEPVYGAGCVISVVLVHEWLPLSFFIRVFMCVCVFLYTCICNAHAHFASADKKRRDDTIR